MGNTYKANGIKYTRKYCHFNNYKMTYELHKQNKLWHAIVESYDHEPITISSISKKAAERELIATFKNYIKFNVIDELIKKNYNFTVEYPDVLYSIHDMLIGYHITATENRESILTNGLIANGNEDIMVRKASQLIDQYKSKRIPDNIIREQSSYAWPMMTNDTFGYKKQNQDIYAIKFHNSLSWVGSQGIGGFCLYYDDEFTDEKNEYERIKAIPYAKDYWKYSCSLQTYLKNSFWTRRNDRYAGLDEIITRDIIDPSLMTLIGYWDDDGIFHEEEMFINYVKPEFKNSYNDILQKYARW